MYDLKAVCNHLGSDINQGHYTATCLDSVDNMWYNFDDRTVKSIHETDVQSADAYILFYQRREWSNRVPGKVVNSIRMRNSLKSKDNDRIIGNF